MQLRIEEMFTRSAEMWCPYCEDDVLADGIKEGWDTVWFCTRCDNIISKEDRYGHPY